MNQDPYEIDAAARNQDAARQRTVKNKEVAKKDLPENITPINFDIYKQVTPSRLECLREGKFAQPVISLYLNLSPDRQIRQKPTYLTVFNSLKHAALQENQSYFDQIPSRSKKSIEVDLLQIHEYLQHRFDPTEARSIALFKSGDVLSWLFTLPSPGQDYLAIDPEPYTLPLTVAQDRQQAALVVKMESGLTSYYRYRNGTLSLLEVIKSQVPDLSLDKSRPNKVQRHNYVHLLQHFKKSSERLSQLARRHRLYQIILVGDDHILNQFKREALDLDQQQEIVASLGYNPGTSQAELAQQVYQVMEQQSVAEEGYYLDMIQREDGANGLIRGLDEVLSAQNRHMVRSLLVNKDLKQVGYFCQQDSFLATEASTCPLCGSQLVMIDNVVDKLVELASQFQVDYKVIRQQSDRLDEYGGIAATMYDVQ